MNLHRPRVLFIGPRMFGYESEIKHELERSGYDVDWYDERPSSTPLIKALIRVHPGLAAPLSNDYFDRILKNAAKLNYEIVFILKGEALSLTKLKEFRRAMPNSKFIYYTWDSLSNVKNSYEKLPCFDKVYSFDRFDCPIDKRIKHLPLFYTQAYEELPTAGSRPDIDLLLLGSLHSDRYFVAQAICRAANQLLPGVRIYKHFYYQSKWVFALLKLIDPQFRAIPWAKVAWSALTPRQTLELISRSRILIDVHHPRQTGLTMRMIESIGAGKKIITTNPDVKYYDFYRPENILVVDRKDPQITKEFLELPYHRLDKEIYCRYSLRMWLNEIFSINEGA